MTSAGEAAAVSGRRHHRKTSSVLDIAAAGLAAPSEQSVRGASQPARSKGVLRSRPHAGSLQPWAALCAPPVWASVKCADAAATAGVGGAADAGAAHGAKRQPAVDAKVRQQACDAGT